MKFHKTYCSQCGQEFGAGDHGFSHCSDHRQRESLATHDYARKARLEFIRQCLEIRITNPAYHDDPRMLLFPAYGPRRTSPKPDTNDLRDNWRRLMK